VAVTEATICGLALLRVGQRQVIGSLTEATTEAQACALIYPAARDAILEEHWWSWATKRQALALSTETRTGWAYAYALPSDCVTARYLWSGYRFPAASQTIPFAIEASADGSSRLLLTDQEDAELVYTAAITTPSLWSAMARDALAWRISADLVSALPVKPQLAAQALAMALRRTLEAAAADRAQSQLDQPPAAEHIRARGGASFLPGT
jgi:hypothetical protein